METLFEQYKNLAYAIVHRNFKYYSEKDDLIQIALIALWDASNTFNPAFNVGFMCYASAFICNKIKDYIRRQKKHHLIDLAEDVELGNYEIDFSKLMPFTLFATIEIPIPVVHTTIPFSHSPLATASAAGLANTG